MVWTLEALGRSGPVTVEVLAGPGGRVLSVDSPAWSLDFRLPAGGLAVLAEFLRAHAGRAAFAECVVGSFLGRPVRLIQDDEFADRLWLRVSDDGQLADFPLLGDAALGFAAAVAEAAGEAEAGV